MNLGSKELIHSVYAPPLKKGNTRLQDIYQNSFQLVEFSLARHALFAGLKSLGLKKGDRILVPGFICRDVLAPFNQLGLEIIFYEVNERLEMVLSAADLPKVQAIFAVHYFGLETNLTPFREYCLKNQAFLISDNAHGLFSSSSSGQLLGTDGDIGIISVRKTLPIANGAVLICAKGLSAPTQPECIQSKSLRLEVKNALRPLVARWGVSLLLAITKLKRRVRFLIKGHAFPTSSSEDEWIIPMAANPCDMNSYIAKMDVEGEKKRRRELFNFLSEFLSSQEIQPLRKSLSEFEVPYAYPFFCSEKDIGVVKERLEKLGLEIVNWPALPTKVLEAGEPEFYKRLFLVRFLW